MLEGSSLVTSFSHTTFASGLEVNGSLKINVPTVKIEYQKKAGSNAPEKIVMLADINTEESDLEIIHSEDTQLDLADFPLKQFDLPTIYVKIPLSGEKGAEELVVPFTQKILLYVLPLSIKGKMKLHLSPIIHATVGCRYDASADWQNLSIDAIDAINLSQFCSNDFTAGEAIYSSLGIFSPIYEIAPYGSDIMKASFQFFNNLSLGVNTSSPNYSLDYQAGIQGFVNLNFWDGTGRTWRGHGCTFEKYRGGRLDDLQNRKIIHRFDPGHGSNRMQKYLAYILIICTGFAACKLSRSAEFPPELVNFVTYHQNPVFSGTDTNTWDHTIQEELDTKRRQHLLHVV
jgi:hypothetical protein